MKKKRTKFKYSIISAKRNRLILFCNARHHLTMRREAVHSLTFLGSTLYFLHTFSAPNVSLGELPSSAPGLVAFVLSKPPPPYINKY